VDYQIIKKNLKLNKDKSIGRVLYIVEGGSTEAFILHKIFTRIFDFEINTLLRDKNFKQYNSKINKNSQVFVINAEESNIKFIKKDNDYLNNVFELLIKEYKFDIENAAIYYLFDRDPKSNTDVDFIKELLSHLTHSREVNADYGRQGLLLLSYPSIEGFTASNFINNCFDLSLKLPIKIGHDLKIYLADEKINQSNIDDKTIIKATAEMLLGFEKMDTTDYNIDDFGSTNDKIFNWQEKHYSDNEVYRIISLLCISLIDLGLITQ
jgi:hypothetical protein